MLKLLGFVSGKSRTGLTRIARLLAPAISVDIVDAVPQDLGAYSGVIAHNVIEDVTRGRLPRLVYLASNATERVLRSAKAQAFLAGATVWTNCETGTVLVRSVGVKARTMYRPNKVRVPSKRPAVPKTRKVLWHWLKDGPTMNYATEALISKAMNKLSGKGFEVVVINSSGAADVPAGATRVTTGGKMDLAAEPDWLGMIRCYDQVDLGRSTFQVVAHGRWALYWRTGEPFTETVEAINDIPGKVEALANEPDEMALLRWAYARANFREPILRQRWQEAITEVFSR